MVCMYGLTDPSIVAGSCSDEVVSGQDARVELGRIVGSLCDVPEIVTEDPGLLVKLCQEGPFACGLPQVEGEAPNRKLRFHTADAQ